MNKTLARVNLSNMRDVYQTISALSQNFNVYGVGHYVTFLQGLGHFKGLPNLSLLGYSYRPAANLAYLAPPGQFLMGAKLFTGTH